MKKRLSLTLLAALVLTMACFAGFAASADEDPVNIALNKTYEANGMYFDSNTNSYLWPDTDNKELTDGILPESATYNLPEWMGLNANTEYYKTNGFSSVIIDLGEVMDISSVNIVVNSFWNYGIAPASEIKYFVSNDNENWTELGTGSYDVDPFVKDGEEYVNKNVIVNNSLTAAASGRYVKAQLVNATGNAWVFIGEFQVFGATSAGGDDSSTEEPTSTEEPVSSTQPSESSAAASSETSTGGTPVTGDTGLVAFAILAVAALAGVVVVKRRK
ncbi:MAG: discoidin domain-containing protein [Eubacteriales bacterium]|jgi:hypothetical protein